MKERGFASLGQLETFDDSKRLGSNKAYNFKEPNIDTFISFQGFRQSLRPVATVL